MFDLLLLVFACDTVDKYRKQMEKIEETYGGLIHRCYPNVKLLYCLGEKVSNTNLRLTNSYIHLPGVQNDYLSASYKQFYGMEYVYKNITQYDAKFIMCFGTDTYINIKKLLTYLSGLNFKENLYIGGHGDSRQFGKTNIYFHNGGAGFILSRSCFHSVAPCLPNILSRWRKYCEQYEKNELIPACDVAIAWVLQQLWCLADIQVKTIMAPEYSFLNCNYKGLCYSWYHCHVGQVNIRNIISCHNMSLGDFDEFTKILKENDYFKS